MKMRILACCIAALLLCGCAKGQSSSRETVVLSPSAAQSQSEDDIDVDLVGVNSNMIYAQVYEMMTRPEDYLGKTVRIEGEFKVYANEELNKSNYVVLIADALACCQQGMEFIWKGEHKFPDDYPEPNSTVQVTGTYQSYEENGGTYYYLETDGILEVKSAFSSAILKASFCCCVRGGWPLGCLPARSSFLFV